MNKKKIEIEVYSSIEEMKNQSDFQKLSDVEALLKVLDLMDLYASSGVCTGDHYDHIEWIDLPLERNKWKTNLKKI